MDSGERPAEFDARLSGMHDPIYGWALFRLRNSEDAKDFVAALTDKLLRAWGQFETGTNFEAWVFCAARHLLIDMFRRKSRSKNVTTFSAVDVQMVERSPDQKQTPEQSAHCGEIVAMIKNMRPLQRDILMAIVVNGEGYWDVADTLGISLGAVKTRIRRARCELQNRLGL